jgi:hypothetical protein
LKNGVYSGSETKELMRCRLVVSDTIYSFEEFHSKAGKLFHYMSPTQLLIDKKNSTQKEVILQDASNKIKLHIYKNKIIVELNNSYSVKLHLEKINSYTPNEYANYTKDITNYHKLNIELKNKSNFNDSLFKNIYDSYRLRDNYKININDFNIKCNDLEAKIRGVFN